MLLYYCPETPFDSEEAVRQGIQAPRDRDLCLHSTLAAAQRAASGPILVVAPGMLDAPIEQTDETVYVATIPSAALQNLNPYRPPKPVTAGGGYVGCSLAGDVAILLIHRRGVWDLPKGKRDAGESIATCAVREVREEVGIDKLDVLGGLGTTEHAYPNEDVYMVKTTYWYAMRTSERTFKPDRHEGIRRVAWARWNVARRHIGYDTLRDHMDSVENEVRTLLS